MSAFHPLQTLGARDQLPYSPSIGGHRLRIRLWKPLHGWREFAGEVGIIVVGVLIALGAQQVVEDWQWRQKAAQTKQILDAELHRNAVSAYNWLTVAPCVDQQLNSIDKALSSARQSGIVQDTPPLTPPLEVFTEDAWLDARAMQVADHLSAKTIALYSTLFFLSQDLAGLMPELHNAAAELKSLSTGVAPISTAEVGAYQRQAGRVRELLDRVELGETLLLGELKKHGIEPSPEEMTRLVKVSRSWAGECAAPPDPQRHFAPSDVN